MYDNNKRKDGELEWNSDTVRLFCYRRSGVILFVGGL